MPFTKTERMHIRVTEDMAREIRKIADVECRSIQDQARFLIALGLKQSRQPAVQTQVGEIRHVPSSEQSRLSHSVLHGHKLPHRTRSSDRYLLQRKPA